MTVAAERLAEVDEFPEPLLVVTWEEMGFDGLDETAVTTAEPSVNEVDGNRFVEGKASDEMVPTKDKKGVD